MLVHQGLSIRVVFAGTALPAAERLFAESDDEHVLRKFSRLSPSLLRDSVRDSEGRKCTGALIEPPNFPSAAQTG